MGALEQAIEKAIKAHVDRLRFVQIITGTAKEVGETTCKVVRDDAPELTGVRLNAIDDALDSYMTVYPKEGSNVIVAIVDGVNTEAVVVRCSEVDRIKCKIEDNILEISNNGVAMNGLELKGWISNVYNDMQTLKTLLQNSPIAGNGAPAAIVFTPTTSNIS